MRLFALCLALCLSACRNGFYLYVAFYSESGEDVTINATDVATGRGVEAIVVHQGEDSMPVFVSLDEGSYDLSCLSDNSARTTYNAAGPVAISGTDITCTCNTSPFDGYFICIYSKTGAPAIDTDTES